ncbi:MAG TPA: type IV pilus twitching motility protein PilT [Dehalococcoidia bacterium]|nr:type IV pilus twitching motility protein PilT [Dehalococcoidia bacterium]
MEIEQLLRLAIDKRASDLHLKVGSPPVLRIDGELVPQDDVPQLMASDTESLFEQVTTREQKDIFIRDVELDFAHGIPGLGRFRVNVLQQRGTISLAFRFIPFGIPSIDEIELPQVLKTLIRRPRGLILVTGHTGSGKSTTLAAMIDHLNENDRRHVIMIEDPIEFLHTDHKCIIVQRDLGDDTKSFNTALVKALRHDPDVLVIGEMRDLGTITTALTAAETGHLVLGTLHTSDAAQTIDRIIDVFPPSQQRQVRLQLSQVLEAVLSQTLLPRIKGGRIAAVEIMLGTPAVRNLIRSEKVHELGTVIQLGNKEGMQTLDQALAALVKKGIVAQEEAMLRSSNPGQLRELIAGAFLTASAPKQSYEFDLPRGAGRP